MSSNARFYIFAGLLFIALAMFGVFSFWEPPFVVRNFIVK